MADLGEPLRTGRIQGLNMLSFDKLKVRAMNSPLAATSLDDMTQSAEFSTVLTSCSGPENPQNKSHTETSMCTSAAAVHCQCTATTVLIPQQSQCADVRVFT